MKNIWTILLSIALAGAIVGGTTYNFVNSKSEKDKNELRSHFFNLNKENSHSPANLKDLATTDWKTYDSTINSTLKDKGFIFKYPKDWRLGNNIEIKNGIKLGESVISLTSYLTDQKNQKCQETQHGNCWPDPEISVYYYLTIKQVPSNKTGAENFSDFIDIKNNVNKIGTLQIDGIESVVATRTMFVTYPTVLIPYKEGLLEVFFSYNEGKTGLNENDKLILSTFQLIK